MITKGKPLAVWNSNSEEDISDPTEFLIQQIIVQATRDYIKCIKQGAIYKDRTVRYNAEVTHDSCTTIIRSINKCDFIVTYYEIDFEYIFKELDKQYGYWHNYYSGSVWIHPWDVLYNNTASNNI